MSRRGFTLMEVLIAMAILSIGLLAGARLLGEGISRGAQARKVSAAHYLANQVIEKLRIEIRFDLEAAAGTGSSGGAALTAANAWKAERLPYSSLDEVVPVTGLTTCDPDGAEDETAIDYNVGPLPYRFEGSNYWLCYQIIAPGTPECPQWDTACARVKVIWRTMNGHQAHRAVAYLASGR